MTGASVLSELCHDDSSTWHATDSFDPVHSLGACDIKGHFSRSKHTGLTGDAGTDAHVNARGDAQGNEELDHTPVQRAIG